MMSLEEFIETPSQNLAPEVLEKELAEFLIVLRTNSDQIINIIRTSFCPATYLVHDLANKMKSQQCLEEFAILYDNHLTDLLELCIYSWHDLQRFIDNYPDYFEKIMESVCDNETYLERLSNDISNSEDIFNNIKNAHPDYDFPDRFSELFLPDCRIRLR
jgi:hypothetical protein